MTYQEAVAVHAAHDRLALEDPLGVLLVEGEEHASGVAKLVQRELHAPELALVAKTELADGLELIVETLLLERTTRLLEGLGVCDGRKSGDAGTSADGVDARMRRKDFERARSRSETAEIDRVRRSHAAGTGRGGTHSAGRKSTTASCTMRLSFLAQD